jgi:pimeloyl-ACP methyl ester carboxylesterase
VHPNGTRALVPDGLVERFVTINGHRMRYLTAGRGPKLLLIHGLMGYSFSWSEVAPALARTDEVFAPDMLNIGLSARADVDPSLEAMADRMWRFADAVGITEVELLASSQGGAIAMKMAVRAPERVTSLVLVSPAHPWSEQARWQIRLFSTVLGPPLAWAMSLAPRLWMAIGLRRQYGDFAKMPAGTLAGYSRPIDRKMLAYLLRVARRWYEDFAALKSEITRIADIPTLLIWGDRDRIVPLTTAPEIQRQFRHVSLEVIPGAGHLPYEEAPADFLSALERGRRTLETKHG